MTEPPDRLDLLRWQFDLTWSLFELHLDQLTFELLVWEPVPVNWNVRQDADRRWVPDWEDEELDPIPVPTIGWITWHIGWWWTSAIDQAHGLRPRDRTDVVWPGSLDEVLAWLRGLRLEWMSILNGYKESDLDASATYPWGDDSGMTVAHTVAWVNAELMKNVSEIGQLRLLWAASPNR
ncbi:DinB family protein [Rhodococcus sp. NPDC076796]|uniref:DinB family protein n=1 Tax=Rhodococcus sp. NPDC076796 TaxID=3154859 RepID=UPI00344BB04B